MIVPDEFREFWKFAKLSSVTAGTPRPTKSRTPDLTVEEDLTFKSQNNKNLDRGYSNLLNKKFWIRRWEQHKFFSSMNKKIFKGLDYLITGFIVYFFLKIF